MIIDGGNSPYKDSIRRAEESTKLGLECWMPEFLVVLLAPEMAHVLW